MIFGVCEILRKFDINSLYICPPYLYTVTTLLWEIQKSHFSTVLFRDFRLLHYLRRNKLQLLYCSLSVYLLLFPTSYYLRSPILWSVFISLVSKATNANPQLALIRVTNIWRNATLLAVICKKFYILQSSVVTFSGVVVRG